MLPPGPYRYMPLEHDQWGFVRDASDNVVAVTCSPHEGEEYYKSVTFGSPEWKAGPDKARAVAELLIRAEREADATAIDEAWLRSVGFEERHATCKEFKLSPIYRWTLRPLENAGHFAFVDACGAYQCALTSRGDVRKLAAALGVSLREP